jgi:hypothetical protein
MDLRAGAGATLCPHLAPVLWWAEYRPLRPDTELPESNSERRAPKSTVVSATLRRSYSVPDLLVR